MEYDGFQRTNKASSGIHCLAMAAFLHHQNSTTWKIENLATNIKFLMKIGTLIPETTLTPITVNSINNFVLV